MFTKQHYELIADVLSRTKPTRLRFQADHDIYNQWEVIVLEICAAFENDNPKFNTQKFLSTIGYSPSG